MRPPKLGTLFALAACLSLTAVPAFATPDIGQKDNGWSLVDERYLTTYEKCWKAFKSQCGRNLVDDQLANGKVPSEQRVKESTATMNRWLSPAPEPIDASSVSTAPAPAPVSVAPASGGYASSSTVQCESGGDYSINTGNGYYGAYQFDSGTWDAYGDPAYGEANEAPPAVQDAAAASVPYDAWPNC